MTRRLWLVMGTALLWPVSSVAWAQTSTVRTTYHVKQIASGAVYLDGGTNDGLTEGMRLTVSRLPPGEPQMKRQEMGEITVVAVASISAVCEAKDPAVAIQLGDAAELSAEDAQLLQQVRTSKSIRHTAQTVAFTEGDPIEEELRQYVPRPPSPAVNRVRGRISFEENAILDRTSGIATMQEGIVLRADMTRIGGTYWNFTGYWRGQFTQRHGGAATVTTLQDILNRTYQIGLYYNNPNSRYVAGIGRFLLPWAPSLSTIDGAYFARRMGKSLTTGVFLGSTPDPTAWNYDPNRQMLGAFVAYEHGSYDTVHLASTAGLAVTRSHWHPERQFVFFENTLVMGTKISIYHDLEADRLAPALVTNGDTGPRLARSFLTLRFQLSKALSLDFSRNYFRDVPTFDLRLLGTGLLDQFLFQGFSAGVKVSPTQGSTFYGNLGSNKREQDPKAALNYMGGLILTRIPLIPFRVDVRYSRFNSTFGSGSYESVTLTRQMSERLRFDLQAGLQTISSTLTNQSRTKYGSASLDYLIRTHYILGAGWTLYRGGAQNYDQLFLNFGYRF
jgi:hypothetical protein